MANDKVTLRGISVPLVDTKWLYICERWELLKING